MSDNTEIVDTTETAPFSDKLYDALKFCAMILFPAIATLYFALADVWNLPDADKVVATIVALDTFLGVFLAFLKRGYDNSGAPYDGTVVPAVTEEGKTVYSLNINPDIPLDNLDDKSELRLKVQDEA